MHLNIEIYIPKITNVSGLFITKALWIFVLEMFYS